MGHAERKFQMEGASFTNRSWCQKPRVIALSCGIRISTVHCFVLSLSKRVMDGQNYDSQDCASIAVSHGINDKWSKGNSLQNF